MVIGDKLRLKGDVDLASMDLSLLSGFDNVLELCGGRGLGVPRSLRESLSCCRRSASRESASRSRERLERREVVSSCRSSNAYLLGDEERFLLFVLLSPASPGVDECLDGERE